MHDEATADGDRHALALDRTLDANAHAVAEVTERRRSLLGACEERRRATACADEDRGPARGRFATRDVEARGRRRPAASTRRSEE
jgi:hypothetical protein